MNDDTWPPRFCYRGPYPFHVLRRAQNRLIGFLSDTSSTILERLKPKIGLDSSYGPAERTSCPLGDYGFSNSSDKFCHEKLIQNTHQGPRPPSLGGASNNFSPPLGFSQGPFGNSSSVNQPTYSSAPGYPKENAVRSSSTGHLIELTSPLSNHSLQGNEAFARSSSTSRLSNVSDDSSFVTNYSTESSFQSTGRSRNTSLNYSDNIPNIDSDGPSSEQRHNDSIPVFYSGMSHTKVSPGSESKRNRSVSPYFKNSDQPSTSTPLKRRHDRHDAEDAWNKYPRKQQRLNGQPNTSLFGKSATVSQPPNDIHVDSNLSSLFETSVISKKEANKSSRNSENTNQNNVSDNRDISSVDDADNDLVYKCDYCRTFFLELEPLEDHLKSCFHSSGSMYVIDNSKTPAVMTLVKMLAVQRPGSHLKNCIIICPECTETFSDIFTCGLHCKYVHSQSSPQYCVAQLIDEKIVEVSIKPNCSKCSQNFGNHSLLHKHWEKEKSHFPVQLDTSSNKINLAVCQDCQKTFTGDFNKAFLHVVYSHNKHLPSSKCKTASLVFKEFLRPKKRETVSEISHSDNQSISVELDILRLIKAQNFKNSRTASSEIETRMKYLQSELQKHIY